MFLWIELLKDGANDLPMDKKKRVEDGVVKYVGQAGLKLVTWKVISLTSASVYPPAVV